MPGADRSRWGLFPWFAEQGADELHPDDAEALRAISPYGKGFELVGEGEGWPNDRVRRPALSCQASPVSRSPAPSHRIGDAVEVL